MLRCEVLTTSHSSATLSILEAGGFSQLESLSGSVVAPEMYHKEDIASSLHQNLAYCRDVLSNLNSDVGPEIV